MESVGQTMAHRNQARQFDYEELVKQIVADPDVAAFIQSERLTPAEIKRSISKFNQYISERNRFLLGDKAYIAKGYKPILVKNEGYADVSYEETPELVEAQKQATINARLNLISLPASLKEASLAKVDLDDVGRYKAFELLTNFVADYPNYKKAIYLYGDFGVGKSYMMAALAHDLSEKRSVSTTLLHYPSFVLDVKNAISSGLVKEKIDEVKVAQVLILDDIGAEQSSPWMRDEILQVILQHRMQENLPTFFTSNFNFVDLERHFATSKNGDETWQARRVMERIKFLAEEVRLEGENRR
ncbi:Primosomal protein DnaI [Streptococcus constellatus]|uniref:Primosomal protein DnaI n=1 Tax=Streptococcus constellatus TaxID=76860 RepID=A0A564U1C7_STRCV|nr:primosomal protein DnaI [Streptococcus constellatus]VUW98874.1 Primosomal protein DnaI [Streptococcus gordonii]VUX13307.1 Primosomal protein DnaI [Streptococcus constellatus]